eukprot:1140436-Pelagomonas_calceolata.AAC.4
MESGCKVMKRKTRVAICLTMAAAFVSSFYFCYITRNLAAQRRCLLDRGCCLPFPAMRSLELCHPHFPPQ